MIEPLPGLAGRRAGGPVVRGACALIPGVKGLSDNIRVVSVVDRFLEHSRIYAFGTGASTLPPFEAGRSEIFLGSADMMHRNRWRPCVSNPGAGESTPDTPLSYVS